MLVEDDDDDNDDGDDMMIVLMMMIVRPNGQLMEGAGEMFGKEGKTV